MPNLFEEIMVVEEANTLRDRIFTEQLSAAVNDLVTHDFEKLVYWLYRMDINETKLRQVLNSNMDEEAGNIIATLMIERQLEKIASRKKFKSPEPGAGDKEERW
ncbi:MAG: hypothetical protein ABIT96_08055 [Ferruginibacter sp.]